MWDGRAKKKEIAENGGIRDLDSNRQEAIPDSCGHSTTLKIRLGPRYRDTNKGGGGEK